MAKNLKIKLNWPVKTINYQDDQKIILINNKGEKLSANIIVITVPLLILKHGKLLCFLIFFKKKFRRYWIYSSIT